MATPSPNRIQQILSKRLPEEIRTAHGFERWFEPLKRQIQLAVQRVHDDVNVALDVARERILAREGVCRDVWFVTGTDGKSLMKLVESVRSKLGRKLCKLEGKDRLPAPIPFFLHALVDAVCEKKEEVGRLDGEVVRRAYREGLLGSRGNTYFKEYKLVHQPYPEDLRKAAGALLRELASRAEGISGEGLRQIFSKTGSAPADFDPLLSCLQEDYDITEQNGRWVMRSKVLRDRWSQREPWLTGEES